MSTATTAVSALHRKSPFHPWLVSLQATGSAQYSFIKQNKTEKNNSQTMVGLEGLFGEVLLLKM